MPALSPLLFDQIAIVAALIGYSEATVTDQDEAKRVTAIFEHFMQQYSTDTLQSNIISYFHSIGLKGDLVAVFSEEIVYSSLSNDVHSDAHSIGVSDRLGLDDAGVFRTEISDFRAK